MNKSVAMATYNGEKYIEKQLDSILCQISKNDEVIISDDNSKDSTIEIIKKYEELYNNVHLIKGPCRGTVYNFENAIKNCHNEIIFLSDQDDIWMPNKVNKVCNLFLTNSNINLIQHDMEYIGHKVQSSWIIKLYGIKHGIYHNLICSAYIGCGMAFRKSFIDKYIPFPSEIIAHDQWIGICAEHDNSSLFIPDKLITRRMHENNQTHHINLYRRILFRKKMFDAYLHYF